MAACSSTVGGWACEPGCSMAPLMQQIFNLIRCQGRWRTAQAPHYPSAVHLARCLLALDDGDYSQALAELDVYQPRWGWADPLIRESIAALHGDGEYAATARQQVLVAVPAFAVDGPWSLWFLRHADHVRLLCNSLEFPVGVQLRRQKIRAASGLAWSWCLESPHSERPDAVRQY